jgi:GTPase
MSANHRSGYIHLFGNPNVGKSSLVKVLCGQKLAIISDRPQTTRHRIFVIYNDEMHQAIFSDAPGWIREPKYMLQERMNQQSKSGLSDAEILLVVTTPDETIENSMVEALSRVKSTKFLIINKVDLYSPAAIAKTQTAWTSVLPFDQIHTVSALKTIGVDELKKAILDLLPEGPAYYPKEDLSDRQDRFFVAEIIRETIFEQYYEEIPYSCEVQTQDFKETVKDGKPFAKISVYIIVERDSQKSIILGQQGQSIKSLGIKSREKIESFLGYPIYLDLQVKTEPNWRNNPTVLKKFGY